MSDETSNETTNETTARDGTASARESPPGHDADELRAAAEELEAYSRALLRAMDTAERHRVSIYGLDQLRVFSQDFTAKADELRRSIPTIAIGDTVRLHDANLRGDRTVRLVKVGRGLVYVGNDSRGFRLENGRRNDDCGYARIDAADMHRIRRDLVKAPRPK